MIPTELLDSILKGGFKDLSIARHRQPDAGDSTETAQVSVQAELLDVASGNINSDFEHQCLSLAIERLGAQQLQAVEGDIGPEVFSIPGIPRCRFLPHQVWGIWFLVNRVIGNSAPVALLADDMGLGKTYTALGALLHLKWISSEAALGHRMDCVEGRTLDDLEGGDVPAFFGSAKELFDRPSIVMVPANLIGQWEIAIGNLIEGTSLTLVNLNAPANRELTSARLNGGPGSPGRGGAIHLISYHTYRSRHRGSLEGGGWGVGLFDESHSVRRVGTSIYNALMGIDVWAKFQLTGTPMYNDVHSWIIQGDWLFSRVRRDFSVQEGPARLRQVLASLKTGDTEMDEAYFSLKTIAHPWMIRRWAESKGANGEPLVALVPSVIHDVRLEYTELEANRLQAFVTELKEQRRGHVATVIHEYRLACLSMSLPGNDTVEGDGDFQYRQSWDPIEYHAGPAIRWLESTLVPILLGEPSNGAPNKAVIFTPLPGQSWFVFWFLKTFHQGLKPFIFHSGLPRPVRDQLIEEFSSTTSPAALVLTPAVGGTGLNLVSANHVVIMQKFWVLNEQRQAMGRIDRLGQKRTPNIWILHCVGSVDDRAEELHVMRASYEARIMHGLLGQVFSYKDLLSACAARARQKQEAEQEKETRAENQQPQFSESPETPSNFALPGPSSMSQAPPSMPPDPLLPPSQYSYFY